jgi:3-oxoacyl-[acyl-carrier protein] reductase
VALVSGAARGIGQCIADNLAAQGALVACVDRDFPRGAAPRDAAPAGAAPPGAAPVGGQRLIVTADLRDSAQVDAAFEQTESVFGPVEILVCNAGIIRTGTITDIDARAWDDVMAVNATAPFLLARRAIPGMRAAGFGRILHISSNAAKMGGVTSAPVYGASKAATDTMLRSIAVTEAKHGITANAVAACLVDTGMLTAAGIDVSITGQIPAGRLGRPEDIAAATLFLASDEAGFITGEVMDVNGGFYVD